MNKKVISQYVNRSQKDYSLSLKLSAVLEIEQKEISLSVTKKYI